MDNCFIKLSIVTPLLEFDAGYECTNLSLLSQVDLGDYNVEVLYVVKSTEHSERIEKVSRNLSIKYFGFNDCGEYDAINHGIKKSEGEYVQVLCGGDEFITNKTLSFLLSKLCNADVISAGIVYTTTIKHYPIRVWMPKWKENSWRRGMMLPHPGLFVKKTVYEIIGLYSLEYSVIADYEFEMRLLAVHRYKPLLLNSVVVRMDTGGRSYGGLFGNRVQQYDALKVLSSLGLKPSKAYFFFKLIDRWSQYFRAVTDRTCLNKIQ